MKINYLPNTCQKWLSGNLILFDEIIKVAKFSLIHHFPWDNQQMAMHFLFSGAIVGFVLRGGWLAQLKRLHEHNKGEMHEVGGY